MFETHVGALQDESSAAYLRPETAQGIFINFRTSPSSRASRRRHRTSKSFRNDHAGQLPLPRPRVRADGDGVLRAARGRDAVVQYWLTSGTWHRNLGLREENLRLREHDETERSHYSSATSDIAYLYPIGWQELGESPIAASSTSRSTRSTRARNSSGSTPTATATRRT
jgi:glycyl-tRNA synthetase